MTVRRCLLILSLLAAPAAAVAAEPIRAVLIIPEGSAAILAGARAGADEARHTASLFRRDFELVVHEVASPAAAAAAARDASRSGAVAVAGGGTTEIADAIARAAAVPFLSIEPPRKPAGDARYQLTPAQENDARVVAWHPDLRRYGAGELNERFLRQTGRRMDGEAWAAWLAMKLVVEAALRNREIGSMRIDGHKGVPLRFDSNRVLQQPLFAVDERGKLAGD